MCILWVSLSFQFISCLSFKLIQLSTDLILSTIMESMKDLPISCHIRTNRNEWHLRKEKVATLKIRKLLIFKSVDCSMVLTHLLTSFKDYKLLNSHLTLQLVTYLLVSSNQKSITLNWLESMALFILILCTTVIFFLQHVLSTWSWSTWTELLLNCFNMHFFRL